MTALLTEVRIVQIPAMEAVTERIIRRMNQVMMSPVTAVTIIPTTAKKTDITMRTAIFIIMNDENCGSCFAAEQFMDILTGNTVKRNLWIGDVQFLYIPFFVLECA